LSAARHVGTCVSGADIAGRQAMMPDIVRGWEPEAHRLQPVR